jgi:plastocyanin
VRFKTTARAKSQFFPRVSVLALTTGLIALAGCGSSSTTSSSAPAATSSAPAATPSSSASTATPAPASSGSLSLAANAEGQLKFDTTSLTAKAGKVSVAFANSASLEHNLTIASSAGQVVGATPTFAGGSKTLSLTLKAGTYKFYCSVPGHRQAGMEGTLTVQ